MDIRAGSAIQKLPEVSSELKEVRWNPTNQNQLIVGSRGGHIIEWDIRSTLDYICYGVDEVRLSRRPVVTRSGYNEGKLILTRIIKQKIMHFLN